MKLKSLITLGAVIVGFGTVLGITLASADDNYWKTNTQSLYTTNIAWLTITNAFGTRLTITNDFETPFLTISNRPFIQFEGGSCVVRVTDAEWNTITNHYAGKIKTNSITFYGK
jgi:hypothetical protein